MRFPNSSSVYLNQLVWAPPDPPQGDIIHYNIRITSADSDKLALVEGVRDAFLDVRAYVPSSGDYLIEVSKSTILYKLQGTIKMNIGSCSSVNNLVYQEFRVHIFFTVTGSTV